MRATAAAIAALTSIGFWTACGGSTPPEARTPPESQPSEPEKAAPTSEAQAEAPPEAAEEPKAEAEPASPGKEREVKYVVVGGKLEIRTDGVRFRPEAKAVRVGNGWGVKLTVTAEAEDDKLHSLLAPKTGALAFAGKVTRGGKSVELADTRDGSDEAIVAPGTAQKLERAWPGKSDAKPLGKGDKIELQVGLWGLGPDASSRRPLKKLLLLTMTVDKGEPRPFIAPPE